MFDRPRIIPCLLINNGQLVKTIRFKNPNYLGDPINAVKIFNEKEVDELCVLDITPYKDKQIDFHLLESIAAEAFMPMAYGGGIKTLNEARQLYHMGYEKLIINTSFFENESLISDIADYAGSQSVVVSLDVKKAGLLKKQECMFRCGTVRSRLSPVEAAKKAEKLGAGEILLNSIDNDGMMQGYDLNLIREVCSSVSIPVIVCGGAGNLEDLREAVHDAGAHAAAAGSIFVYFGKKKAVLINYPTEQELVSAGIFNA